MMPAIRFEAHYDSLWLSFFRAGQLACVSREEVEIKAWEDKEDRAGLVP
jgi:hypothetical protein